MTEFAGLSRRSEPDRRGLVDTILRGGTPKRVHHLELFQDVEIRDAIAARFDLAPDVKADDEFRDCRLRLAVGRFCGFDYVRGRMLEQEMPFHNARAADTAALGRVGGRVFRDEHVGPITSREELERYPWPDPEAPGATRELEWLEAHVPEDMCIVAQGLGHFCEHLAWLMGYETLCYALYDDRDLVRALADRLVDYYRRLLGRMLAFDRVRVVFASDDMGHKTGLLISPRDMREFVLPGHKALASMTHAAGRPYILHSCGNLGDIIDELVDDVKIDGKHSFEDTIEDVREAKRTYGRRTALLGGIDVDFLCRSDVGAIRQRVRETLEVCQPGGGYCLGTGNSVANYIPLDHYLAMVDEGRLWGR